MALLDTLVTPAVDDLPQSNVSINPRVTVHPGTAVLRPGSIERLGVVSREIDLTGGDGEGVDLVVRVADAFERTARIEFTRRP